MAIIQIPDDTVIERLVARRSRLRDVSKGGAWADEPIVGEITQRAKQNRRINLLNGVTTLANIRKLTIIGHGSSHGWLIGPYATSGNSSPTDPIAAADMAQLLRSAGYAGGYSIDVMGCFSEYFARQLSLCLAGIYVKGYTDPITIEDGLPIYKVGGPRLGKALISPHEKGAPEGEKGKRRYLNGNAVDGDQYKKDKTRL